MEDPVNSNLTILHMKYIEQMRIKRYSQNTINTYSSILKKIFTYFNDYDLEHIPEE